MKQAGGYEIGTYRRVYHINYSNINLFGKIFPPLLELAVV